jgi:2-polyprenyl-3-methyl-5-hydroxy-6-metoxy-1,4-benzoquinol methylase
LARRSPGRRGRASTAAPEIVATRSALAASGRLQQNDAQNIATRFAEFLVAECLRCNVCDQPGTFAEAKETARVHSNVRKFMSEALTVWRCTGCDSLHCKEDVDLAHYYGGYIYGEQRLDYFSRCAYAARIRQLKRWGWTTGRTLLDYGCGSGVFLQLLRERGADVAGYDPYHAAWNDGRTLDSQYDFVTTYDVIEHVDDPETFLRERSRLVRPGGTLVIVTPNASKLSLKRPNDPEFHQPYHRHILSERALKNLGAKVGLELQGLEHHYFIDTPWPAVNLRFVWEYVHATGGVLDVVFEPPQTGLVLRSPKLSFYALFGYWFSPQTSIAAAFRVR